MKEEHKEKRCRGCGDCLKSDARTGEECVKFRECSCHNYQQKTNPLEITLTRSLTQQQK
jgi:hypothetical protein